MPIDGVDREFMVRAAKFLIHDAERLAAYGTRHEMGEVFSWVLGDAAPWSFEDTCDIIHIDCEKERKKIIDRIRRSVEIRQQLGHKL